MLQPPPQTMSQPQQLPMVPPHQESDKDMQSVETHKTLDIKTYMPILMIDMSSVVEQFQLDIPQLPQLNT